ncbi:MAG: hypothetical protein ACLVI5_12805, partial [Desulfovibrio piger]|uniref:hypothetical protein n=1 Tax=Desulfovibrio piger TaxID=901 RepID=UPI00399AF526
RSSTGRQLQGASIDASEKRTRHGEHGRQLLTRRVPQAFFPPGEVIEEIPDSIVELLLRYVHRHPGLQYQALPVQAPGSRIFLPFKGHDRGALAADAGLLACHFAEQTVPSMSRLRQSTQASQKETQAPVRGKDFQVKAILQPKAV